MTSEERIVSKANALVNELLRQGYDIRCEGQNMPIAHFDIWFLTEGEIRVEKISDLHPFRITGKRTKGYDL